MSTQLRLVEAPLPARAPAKASVKTSAKGSPKGNPKSQAAGGRKVRPATASRRAAHWGEWHLDARTRSVGRAGVAAARRALEEVAEADEHLWRAS
jgi:hypothetical protein